MKGKSYNKIFGRMLAYVSLAMLLLILSFLFLLFLLVRVSLFDIDYISESNALALIVVVISILIFTQTLTILWVQRVSRPAKILSEAAAKVAQGNFDVRIDTSNFKDEMLELGNIINMMIQELDSIELMRSDFVANVSHEFKAPISSIQGCVTLISSPNITEKQKDEYFQQLKDSTRQLSALVDNILRLSRLESQSFEIKREKFRLDEQLRRSVLLFERQWSAKDLELELELPECSYIGTEELLGQVWINLVGNAVKYTQAGGKIGICLTEKDDCVQVLVSDNGPGMDDEVKKHAFEKFYQGDTSHKTEGNGLGLALVKSICQITGCDIKLDSAPGKGSVFTVSLPKRP